MSSLLEQAIVDAKALRDAALKNAEQLVIEKYSDQVKEAVSTLLEQEEDLDMGLGLGGNESTNENEEQTGSEQADQELMDEVSPNETDKITLDLTELEKRIEKIEQEEGEAGVDALDAEKIPSADVAADMADDIAASPDADSLATEGVAEWEQDIEDMIVGDILESLKVDIKPQKRGWLGLSDEDIEHAAELELARMQDDKVKEEMEAMRAALKKLEEANKKIKKNNKLLKEENVSLTENLDAYKGAVEELKEKFDVVNTSNAKLLYINRTLGCGSLNERQKKKIVEAIAKTDDANEAKVIYETLQSTVQSEKKKTGPESLSEAVDRRPSLLVRSREEKRTTSADIFAERMQRLAGITKQ